MPDWGFETRQIHAGAAPDPTTGARAVPIYQTTSYTFRDTAHAAALFGLEELGNIYTRIMNPTQAVFEERVASLEGGVAALAVASGQAAETIALLNLAENGGHVVSSASLYGGTYNLLHYTLPKFGIEVTFVDDPDDLDAWRAAIRPNTKAFYAETLGNPKGDVLDFETRVGHRPRARYPPGGGQHPGHAVPGAAPAPRGRHRGPLGHQVHRGPRDVHRRDHRRRGHLRLRGQRTVPRLHRARPQLSRAGLRPAARSTLPGPVRAEGPPPVPAGHRSGHRSTQLVPVPAGPRDPQPAGWSATSRTPRPWPTGSRPATTCSGWPTPAWSRAPGTERQQQYLPHGGGAILAFGIDGGADAGRTFIEGLELFSHLANVGDVRSLAIHPASTTHSQLTEAEQITTGVTPDLVRLCIGLESIEDIIADLEAGFRSIKGT